MIMSHKNDVLVCPYCNQEQDTHELDVVDAMMANTECEHCGKLFWYSVVVERSYDSWTDEGESENEKWQE